MAYSQTYNFGTNTYVDSFIRDAFEDCGIASTTLTGLQVNSAILGLNFMLSEWANNGLNLFTVEKAMFQINVGQPGYILPTSTIETTEVTASNNTRLLGGTAFSSAGGSAQNAFSGTPGLACTQTAPNGYISYVYPIGYTPNVYYVGVQSNVSQNYSIVYEYSYDNITWFTGLVFTEQFYPAGQLLWFVLPASINVMAARIRETGGATLDIQEIYFSEANLSRILLPISREEYTSYPNKETQATPSSFYLDRQNTPIMTLWPTPDNTYQTIVYNRSVQIMDVTQMNQNINIPQRFMNAVKTELAAKMALKYALDRYPILAPIAERSFALASQEDVENVPMRVSPNFISYT